MAFVDELDEAERASWERAMATIRTMDESEKWGILEHAVASTIRYAGDRRDEGLRDWARTLLLALRLAATPAHGTKPESPARPVRSLEFKELLGRLRSHA